MSYTFHCTVQGSFDHVVERAKAALAAEGFGVLTEIDVQATMARKLDATMPPYRILGACHPASAWRALQAEPRIGSMLPCNVVVRALSDTDVEVAAVDPVSSMQAVDNPELGAVATEVRARLQRVIQALQ
jgi:uncharacterized protein (DUF302 family)